MKAALVVLLALGLLALAAPPPAEAHVGLCPPEGTCLAECQRMHATTPPPHLCLPILLP